MGSEVIGPVVIGRREGCGIRDAKFRPRDSSELSAPPELTLPVARLEGIPINSIEPFHVKRFVVC